MDNPQEVLLTLRARNEHSTTSPEEKATNRDRAVLVYKQTLERVQQIGQQLSQLGERSSLAPAQQQQYDQLNQDYQTQGQLLNRLSSDLDALVASARPAQVQNDLEAVATATQPSPELVVSAQRVIDTIRHDPQAYDLGDLNRLVDSPVLDTQQLAVISAHRDMREAANRLIAMDNVHKEVIYGGGPRKGLLEYRDSIVQALDKGDLREAQSLRSALQRFHASQVEKNALFTAAYAPYRIANEQAQPVQDTPEARAARQRVGEKYQYWNAKKKRFQPYSIGEGAGRLVDAVGMETQVLEAGLREVDALLAQAGVSADPLSQPIQRKAPAQAAPTPTPTPAPAAETVQEPAPAAPTPEQQAQLDTLFDAPTAAPTPEPKAQVPRNAGSQSSGPVDPNDPPSWSTDDTVDAPVSEPQTQEPVEASPVNEPVVPTEPSEQEQLRELVAQYDQELREMQQILKDPARIKADAKRNKLAPQVQKELLQTQVQQTQALRREALQRIQELDGTRASDASLAHQVTKADDAHLAREADTSLSEEQKHKAANPWVRYFQARQSRSGVPGLLHRVTGIMEILRTKTETLQSYLRGRELDTPARTQLAHFSAFQEQVRTALHGLVKPVKPGYAYAEPARALLFDAQGNLRDDVVTAFSAALYTWLSTQAGGYLYNDRRGINAILGNPDPDASFPSEAWDHLGAAGLTESLLISHLGRDALKILNLQAKSGTPANIAQEAEASVGSLLVGLLHQQNLLTTTSVTRGQLATWSQRKLPKDVDPRNQIFLVRPVAQPSAENPQRDELGAAIQPFVAQYQAAGNVIGDLFQSASVASEPSLKPVDKLPKFLRGTRQLLPKKLQEALLRDQKRGRSLNSSFSLFDDLSREQQEQIAGIQDEANVYYQDRKAVRGKNNAIRRQLDGLTQWKNTLLRLTGSLDTPFFLRHAPWQQMRVGLQETLINPQASKVQRGLIKMQNWVGQVPVDPAHPTHRMFLQAVAQSLDIGIDKQNEQASIDALHAKLKEPVFAHGLAALQLLMDTSLDLDPEMKAELQADLTQAVLAGKEGTHSLHGLVNYARYQQARVQGATEFMVDLSLEIDGVTNGPAIGTLQLSNLGRRSLKTIRNGLARFGLFVDARTSYGDWATQPGNLDSYQFFAKAWGKALQDLAKDHAQDKVAARQLQILEAVLGDLRSVVGPEAEVNKAARNLSKPVVMAPMYSQGKQAVLENLRDGFWAKIREKITTIAQDEKLSAQEKLEKLQDLDQVLRELGNRDQAVLAIPALTKRDPDTLLAEVLDTPLERNAVYAINGVLDVTYGETAWETIETLYGDIRNNAKAFNQTLEAVNTIYRVVYAHAVEQRTQELVAEGKLATKYQTLPLSERKAIEQKLKRMMPILESAFEPDNPDTGVHFIREDKVDLDRRARTEFTGKITRRDAQGKPLNQTGSISTKIQDRVPAPIGVKAMVMAIQHIDAVTMLSTVGEHGILNVHDGAGVSINNAQKASASINTHFMDTNEAYSLTGQARQTLERALAELTKYEQEQGLKPNSLKGQVQALLSKDSKDPTEKSPVPVPRDPATRKVYLKDPLAYLHSQAVDLHERTTESRTNLVERIAYVLQYNLETGGVARKPKRPWTAEQEQQEQQEQQAQPEQTPQPVTATQEIFAPLKASLEATPHQTLGQLAKDLVPQMKGNSTQIRMMKALLKQLANLGPKIQVQYVADQAALNQVTNAGALLQLANPTTYGLAASGPTERAIYLKPEGLSLETLVHEALHTLIDRTVMNPASLKDTQLGPVLKRLAKLYQVAKAHQKANPTAYQIQGNEFQNVREFVAWGLTNPEFRNYLKTIESAETAGPRKSLFERLVQYLQKAIFGRSKLSVDQQMNRVLTQLIEDTGVLLENSTPQAANRVISLQQVNDRDTERDVQRMTSGEILQALGALPDSEQRSADHRAHLAQVLTDFSQAVTGPFGVHLQAKERELGDSDTQFLQHLVQGTRPQTSRLTNLGIRLSHQEAYVAEWVEAVLGQTLDTQSDLVRELDQLYKQAQAQTDYRLFMRDGVTQAQAEAQWQAVFQPQVTEATTGLEEIAGEAIQMNTSNYLHTFAALAVSYGPLQQGLAQVQVETPQQTPRSLAERIQRWVERVVKRVNQLFNPTRPRSGTLPERTQQLLSALAQMEVRQKQRIAQHQRWANGRPGQLGSSVVHQAQELVGRLMQGNPNTRLGRAINATRTMTSSETSEIFMDQMMQIRDRMVEGKHGFLANLFTDMRGATSFTRPFFERIRWAKRDIEQARRHTAEWTGKLVMGLFGEPLTQTQENALTRVLAMGDTQALLDQYSLADLEQFLDDPQALERAIRQEIGQLHNLQHGVYYINESRALGYRMTGGVTRSPAGMRNAHNIAYLGGLGRTIQDQVNLTEAEQAHPVIDRLASLWALHYSTQENKQTVLELLRQERNYREQHPDSGPNGVEALLHFMRKLHQDARESLFAGSEISMEKGYTGQITNPYKSVVMAPLNQRRELEAQGYTLDHRVRRDPSDPDQDALGVYVIKDGGLTTFTTGIVSYTNQAHRGESIVDRHLLRGPGSLRVRRQVLQQIEQARQADLQAYMTQVGWKPEEQTGHRMVPLLNQAGDVTDYINTMTEQYRDTLLERDYRISKVLGAQAGNQVDKLASKEHNEKTVDLLHDAYMQNYFRQPESYEEVSPTSGDAELRELWFMLPAEMRRHIRQKFGRDALPIRKDLRLITLGYRKASVSSNWLTPEEERNLVQKGLITTAEMVAEHLFHKDKAQARMLIRAAGQGVTEIVKALKDWIVIRSFFTLTNNVVSNLALLLGSGVPMKELVKWHKEAITGARMYREQHRELFMLQRKLQSQGRLLSQAEQAKLRGEVARLEHQLTTNPVHELIAAGAFQTIVEDIDQDEDPYSYKSQLMEWMEPRLDRLPPKSRQALEWLVVAKNTPLYQAANEFTQLSDFVARYTKYKYLTEMQAEPLSKRDAMQRVMDDFIQYDVPQDKLLQWLNDTGLVMFSKYYVRIQGPLIRLFRDQPIRVMAMLMGHDLLDYAMPYESSLLTNDPLNRLYNPLETAISVGDEIAPVNGLLHLLGVKN